MLVTRSSTGSYTDSFRANYQCTGGTLFSRVGDAIALMSGAWCPVPANNPISAPDWHLLLPAGWSAHPNGKWDMPITVPATHSTWGRSRPCTVEPRRDPAPGPSGRRASFAPRRLPEPSSAAPWTRPRQARSRHRHLRTERRRSFRLGVWNGALYQGGEGFVDANTVIPVFLSSSRPRTRSSASARRCRISAGSSAVRHGAVPLAPAALARALPLRRGRARSGLRAARPAHRAARRPSPRGCSPRFSSATGPTHSVRGSPQSRSWGGRQDRAAPRLGAYWALRLFWGGLLAGAAGLFVASCSGTGPTRCALPCSSPSLPCSSPRLRALLGHPRAGRRAVPETASRSACCARALHARARRALPPPADRARHALGVVRVAPFIVLSAVRQLGGSARTASTFLLVRMAGLVASNVLWTGSVRYGDRAVRIGAVACSAPPWRRR